MTKKNKKEECRNADEDSLVIYLQEINRYPLLSREEETELARMAARGDKAAKDKLVNSNLRFVISIAKKYQGRGLNLQDLISEGNIGMLSAVQNYNAEKGNRFITYAVWWIRQSIIKAIQDKGRMIRLPVNKVKELDAFIKTMGENQAEHHGETDRNIRIGVSGHKRTLTNTAELLNISLDVLSLDEQTTRNEAIATFKELVEDEQYLSPEDLAINSVLREELRRAIEGLDKKLAEIIRQRFGLDDAIPLTLKEVGDRHQLSRERIRQIEKRALLLLERISRENKLDSYIAS